MSKPIKKIAVIGAGTDPIREIVGAMEKVLSMPVEDLVAPNSLIGLASVMNDLRKEKTYAFELVRFSMKDSEHFKRTDLYFDAVNLHAVYDCDLDGRKYEVCIKALS